MESDDSQIADRAGPLQMDSLIRSLPAILQSAGDSAEVVEAACLAAWKHAAGDGLRSNAVPLRLSQKTLVVAVADETWQKQLQSLSGQMLARLNAILGQPLVTFLEFRVDQNVLVDVRRPREPEYERANSHAVPLELAAAAARIDDRDLRRVFLGAAASCISRLETKSLRS